MPSTSFTSSTRAAAHWGVLRGSAVTPVARRVRDHRRIHRRQRRRVRSSSLARRRRSTLADVRLLSPVTRNQQFVCQGANYRQHMIESGMDPDAKTLQHDLHQGAELHRRRPIRTWSGRARCSSSTTRSSSAWCSGATSPASATVTDENLHEFVAGIVIVNDYSARDVQIPQMQFYKGKSFRTFGPVGPYLCLLEPSDMPALQATCGSR